MPFYSLLLLLLIVLLIWFWRNNLRAREAATKICRSACASYQVQFLDHTVALEKLSPSWSDTGLTLLRSYTFDYNRLGSGRATGRVVMFGTDLLTLQIDELTEDQSDDS